MVSAVPIAPTTTLQPSIWERCELLQQPVQGLSIRLVAFGPVCSVDLERQPHGPQWDTAGEHEEPGGTTLVQRLVWPLWLKSNNRNCAGRCRHTHSGTVLLGYSSQHRQDHHQLHSLINETITMQDSTCSRPHTQLKHMCKSLHYTGTPEPTNNTALTETHYAHMPCGWAPHP